MHVGGHGEMCIRYKALAITSSPREISCPIVVPGELRQCTTIFAADAHVIGWPESEMLYLFVDRTDRIHRESLSST
jgi:hypothetical protein